MNEQQVFEAVFKATGVGDFEKAIAGAQDSIKSFESASGKIKDTGKTLTKGVTAPLVALGGVSMAVGSQYEASMSKVQAISGASADEMKAMEGVARDLGATTRFSASEAADGMSFLAMAGFDTSQVLDAIPDMLDLAAASGMDLASTADIATNILTGFALEAGEAGRVADVLAAASSSANTDVAQLGEAMAYVAPVAQGAGISMEEASAAVGMLSDAGIQGGRAGTTLRNVISRLQNPTGDAVTVMEELGLTMEDLDPTTQTLAEVMGTLEASGMDSADAMRFFGQEAGPGMTAMLEQGSDKLADFTASLNESEGAAGEMAAIMDDNVLGALLGLKSAAEDVAITFFEMAEGPIRAIIDAVTEAVRWFGGLGPVMQQVIGIMGVLAAAVGPVLALIGQMGLGVSALGKFFIGTAGGTSAFATVLSALSSPITAVIVAIGAFIGVLIYLYNTNEVVRDRIDTAWQFIKDVITNVSQAISGFVMSIWGRIQNWLTANQDAIRSTVDTAWNAIVTIVDTIMAVVVPLVQTGWEAIKVATEVVWNVIKAVVEVAITTVLAIIQTVMQVIEGDWSGAWETIKGLVLEVWEIIVEYANIIFGVLRDYFVELWESVKEVFSTAWNGIKEYLVELWNSIKESAASIWESIWTTISEASSNAWNAIVEWFGGLPEWFSETWNTIVEGVTTWASNMITKAIEVGTQFLEAITTFFSELPYNIGFFLGEVIGTVIKWGIGMGLKAYETGSTFVSNLIEWIQQLPGRIANWLSNAYERVTTWASNMWNKAKETGRNFINGIIEWFQQLPGRVQQWLSNTLSRVSTWVSNMATKAREAGSQFITNVINFVQQLPGKIQTWLTNAISKVTTFVSDMGRKAREAGQTFIRNITTTLSELPGKMVGIGRDIVMGLWNGIKGMWDSMTGWVGDLATGFIRGVKSKFGVKSPSRVFRDEIGKMIVRGFGQGIERNEKEAINPMNRMLDNVIGVFDSQTSGLGATFSVAGEGNITSAMNRALDVDMPMVNGRISHEMNNNLSTQPAYINLNIGGRDFKGFVDNITEAQDETVELEMTYL